MLNRNKLLQAFKKLVQVSRVPLHDQAELLGEKKPGEYGSRAYAKDKISGPGYPREARRPHGPRTQILPNRLGTEKVIKFFGSVHIEELSSAPAI